VVASVTPRVGPAYWFVSGIAAVLAIAAIWLPVFPPMTDVPQHAAQMSIIANYSDPAFGFRDRFHLDFLTPYLLTYLVGAALTAAFNALIAVKILTTVAVAGTATSVHWLTRVHGRDPWLALLAWPLAFSASFYWGFLPFMCSLPLGIAAVAASTNLRQHGSVRLAALTTALVTVTAITHPLTGLFVCGLIGITALWPLNRSAFVRLLPVVPAAVLLISWGVAIAATEASARSPFLIDRTQPWRLLQVPLSVLWWGADPLASVFGSVVCASIAIALWFGWRQRTSFWIAAVPPGLALVAYLILPEPTFGTYVVYPRFAAVALLLAIPVGSAPRSPAFRAVIAICAIGWLAVVAYRMEAFGDEADEFAAVIAHIPPNRRIAALVHEPASKAAPAYPYWHFPAWYQAAKGGAIPYSIADHHAVVARSLSHESDPSAWDANTVSSRGLVEADYIVVRTGDSRASPRLPDGARLVLKRRFWSLWQRAPVNH
jgi:hypothetical protein